MPIITKRIIYLLLFFHLFFSRGYSAELILTPIGILLRSLERWDPVSRLVLSTDGDTQFLDHKNGRAEKLFQWTDFCKKQSYVEQDAKFQNKKSVDLKRLCLEDSQTSMQFALISDTQNSNRSHAQTAQFLGNLIAANPLIKFVVHGGDFVQFSYQEHWQKYRDIATTFYSHRIPILPVHGNHDYYFDPGSSYFRELYSTESTQRGYYVIEFEWFVIVVLNSNIDELTEPERANQDAWLEDTLGSFAGKKWMVVAYHHPGYSSATSCLMVYKNAHYIQEHWLPLFSEYGVSLILNGHNHLYERLRFDGIEQVNAGPAGGDFCSLENPDPYAEKIVSDVRTVTVFQIEAWGNLEITSYDIASGSVIDRATVDLPSLSNHPKKKLDFAQNVDPSLSSHN